MSDAGCASGVIYSRKNQKCCVTSVRGRSDENVKEAALQTPRSEEEEEEEDRKGSRHQSRD